ncbi:amidase signature domain-containing protein [Lophiotrema nucula]|uniref:Amidase signature domain-containing protein n=1 Tax=Lophiotrema nucula TaxID=690887 RepID=A0A6A5ZDR1_9PLEO|nr:amidase signature domain-containing protein [Lophiotrema nucula]
MKGSSAFNPLTIEARDRLKLLQNGSLRSVDLVETYVKQIQRHDGYLHAMISTLPKEKLLRTAQTLDEERAAEKIRSPLHGLLIILKVSLSGNIATHPSLGLKTTAGSLALDQSVVKKNAGVVATWMVCCGQTQSAYTTGDVDPDDGKDGHSASLKSFRIILRPAVAVSAGFAPFSIATETDGSLIVPAARAALYGMKPTIGLVPQIGIVPVSHNMDAADRETRESQGSYTTAVTESWEGIGVATLDPEVWNFPAQFLRPVHEATVQTNKETGEAYQKLEEVTKPYAHHVDIIDLDLFKLDGRNSKTIVLNDDLANDINEYLEGLEVSPVRTLAELIKFNKQNADSELSPRDLHTNTSSEDYERHLAHFRDVAKNQALDRIFAKYNVNVIIAPADSKFTCFASGSGYPVASLPLSYLDYNGRLFRLAAIAAAHEERSLIQAMSA